LEKIVILQALFESLNTDVSLSTGAEVRDACLLIIRVQKMDNAERDTLRASCQHGPLHDGDIPEKTARDVLVKEGFISKVVVKGEQGYNACTYKGHAAYKLISAGA
jgi:hypothetical protein